MPTLKVCVIADNKVVLLRFDWVLILLMVCASSIATLLNLLSVGIDSVGCNLRLPDAVLDSLGSKREKLQAEVREFNTANDLAILTSRKSPPTSVTTRTGTTATAVTKSHHRVLCEPVFDPPNLPINPLAVGSIVESMKADELEGVEFFGEYGCSL